MDKERYKAYRKMGMTDNEAERRASYDPFTDPEFEGKVKVQRKEQYELDIDEAELKGRSKGLVRGLDIGLEKGKAHAEHLRHQQAVDDGKKGGRSAKFNKEETRSLAREVREAKPAVSLDNIANMIGADPEYLKRIDADTENPPAVSTIRAAIKNL